MLVNYLEAISTLSQVIKPSETSVVDQNGEVLSKVSLYLSQFSTFVEEAPVVVVTFTVS